MVRLTKGVAIGVVCAVAVGAFNLSLVRGCAHYCKLNSLGSLRRVTAASATVICPRRACVYVRGTPCLVKNGRGTRCPSHRSGVYRIYGCRAATHCDLYRK